MARQRRESRALLLALLVQLAQATMALGPAEPPTLCEYLRAPGTLSEPAVLERARAADRTAALAAAARGAPAPGARFLVAMRSIHVGSSWLTELLRKHSGVSCVAREWWKVFNCCVAPVRGAIAEPPPPLHGRSKALDALGVRACNARMDEAVPLWESSLRAWFENADADAAQRGKRGRAVGFKNQLPLDLMLAHDGHDGPARCSPLSPAQARAYEANWWQLLGRLRVRVVCLHRANALARLLSNGLSHAELRDNSSYLVRIRPQSALEEAALELRFKRLCERGSRHVPVHWLGYEDLYLGDRAARFSQLEQFLALDAQPAREGRREKRAPRDIASRIANIAELRAHGGLLAAMLSAEFGVHDPRACPNASDVTVTHTFETINQHGGA